MPGRAASTSRRNACGVCARKTSPRGSVDATHRCAVARLARASPCRWPARREWPRRSPAPAAIIRLTSVGAGKRPRRIVHEHDVGVGGDGGKGARHRVLPALPARHGPDRHTATTRVTQAGSGSTWPAGKATTTSSTSGCVASAAEAALEHRLAVEVEELLGPIGAEPGAQAARGQDGAHDRRTGHAIHRAPSAPPTAAAMRAAVAVEHARQLAPAASPPAHRPRRARRVSPSSPWRAPNPRSGCRTARRRRPP